MAGGWFSAHAIVMPESLHEHFIWFRSFVLFLLQLFFFVAVHLKPSQRYCGTRISMPDRRASRFC